MTDLPGRSLIAAEYLTPEHDNAVRVLLTCDCGQATDLTVIVDCPVHQLGEAAFTCSCLSVHWFEISSTGGDDD
jgi:hypothetical protein